MIQIGLYNLLVNDPGLSALIADRITPVMLPEDPTLPALTYLDISLVSEPTFESSGMQRMRVQFDSHAEGYQQSIAVQDALRLCLDGYQGLLSDGTFLQNAQRISAMSAYDDVPRQFRAVSEYYLFFTLTS